MKRAKRIKPETIKIGDVIRVSWTEGSVTYQIVGTVAARNYDNAGTEWVTKDGYVLLYRDNALRAWNPGRRNLATVTLLGNIPIDTPLEGIDL